MKRIQIRVMKVIIFSAFLMMSTYTGNTQVVVKRRVEGGEGIFHIQELQAIITNAQDTVKILTVLPIHLRPEGYQEVKIKENDEILMLNAKRVKSVKKFKEIYDGLEIGAMVKMGIRRQGEFFIVSFAKVAPESLPKNRNVMIRVSKPGEGEEQTGGKIITQTVTLGGEDSENIRPWFGTGLMLGMANNKIKVMQVLEGMTEALGNADIKQGDIIDAINGQQPKSLEQFFEAYEKIKVGSKIELKYTRGDKKMQASFEKPETKGRRIIKQN